jgi:4-hydroxybenzoyl-CoA reductase subunit beta
MMRLPKFTYLAPKKTADAVTMLAEEGPPAMLVAGGTDLYPNMKRRHQMPKTLIGLRRLRELRGIHGNRIGSATLLSDIEHDARLRETQPAFWRAVQSISTPVLRNMGTIGGNVCLDTRCNYYNQNYEWRRAIHFCMKCEGKTCWVAPSSDRCLAVNSSDTAPVLCALGAKLKFQSKDGERVIDAGELYQNDGIQYLKKRPDELLVDIELPAPNGWRATYLKLRRRGAFDFPVLGVAVRLAFEGAVVKDARIWLGAVSSAPVHAVESEQAILGKPLTDDAIAKAAEAAFKPAKPMDNTDFHLHWRKEMVKNYVRTALAALRPR